MMRMADRRPATDRRALALVVCALLATVLPQVGCASKWVTLRSVPRNPLVDQLQLTAYSGPKPSARTMQLLRVYNLDADWENDPRQLLEKLQGVIDREPSADKVYALGELAYLGAKRIQPKNPDQARDLYGAAVLHAYRYLFDPRFAPTRNPYDPQFRGACDVYNSALEASLRIQCQGQRFAPGSTVTIQTSTGPWDVTCVLHGGQWRPEEFDHFDFVSNYEIRGLKNQYQTYGLGVPLIAVRKSYDGEPTATRYYPGKLSFPVTAFLRPISNPTRAGTPEAPERHRAVLEMYDPLTATDIVLGNVRVPMESDLTTPLAYFLSDFKIDDLATEGLLNPEVLMGMRPGRSQTIMGLYMIQPYEPGKIPVLMVHGLWSSPMTWMEMFNDLRSQPEIRDRYQFWFYLYPTGQPFWLSAAQLRNDLIEVRRALDPNGQEPALDQMVLIGHSMGGLVSKMQTLNSGNEYWRLVSDTPLPEIKAADDVRSKLQNCFYFQPNPSVRRVITIATPHHGSNFSNQTTQWLAHRLIRLQQMLASQEKLFSENPQAFGGGSLLRIETSVDSLSPSTAIFPVMANAPRASWVHYHTIAGLVPAHGIFGTLAAGGDGVVALDSARQPNADSELVVPADHMTVHTHPLAVLEVRRILQAHLAELESYPALSRGHLHNSHTAAAPPVLTVTQ